MYAPETTPHPSQEDTFYAKTKQVGCDGGDELGHPLVYLEIDNNGKVSCPYCSRKFIYRK